MSEKINTIHSNGSEEHEDKKIFGFWIYLMTDLIMFATLFATYAVLRNNTFGGPGGKELFNLPFVLAETFVLLTSSFTCGLLMLAVNKLDKLKVWLWLAVTFLLGATFLAMEISEFSKLVVEGHGPTVNAFLSSYFTLVGMHGLHIAAGLLWIIILAVFFKLRGLNENLVNKLTRFTLFWHFLDVVWIFIFTIVYLYAKII